MEEWWVKFDAFLTSAVGGGEWSASRPGHFISRKRVPTIYWIGGWWEPRAGVEALEKGKSLPFPGTGTQLVDRKLVVQSLY
jgi:hypothetical protein